MILLSDATSGLRSFGTVSVWPWVGTEVILVASLFIVVFLFAIILIQQHRQVKLLRKQIGRTKEDTSQKIRRYYEYLLGIQSVSHSLASATDPQVSFDRLVQVCLHIFECEQASLMLLDSKHQELEVRSAIGHADKALVCGARQAVGDGVAGWVAAHREALLLGPNMDAQQFRDFQPKNVPISAAMVVPIIVRDELVGVLNVGNTSRSISYDQEDLQTLQTFAEHAGICIRHMERTQWMRAAGQRSEQPLGEWTGNDKSNAA